MCFLRGRNERRGGELSNIAETNEKVRRARLVYCPRTSKGPTMCLRMERTSRQFCPLDDPPELRGPGGGRRCTLLSTREADEMLC
ncbi:hypothetical protein E2C01_068780 [Portunus trituberculatus]|uniref:Uncharacterized protein n=1 Tax=Portunus trituberculatus TaxID=210409 RepID=A0A5B7HSX7_PORTR|nr:hypothetical protein [Portunus trituberculatus]